MAAATKISAVTAAAPEIKPLPVEVKGKSFQEIKEALGGKDLFSEIRTLQQNLLNGKGLTARELIFYQIKAGQFNLRVELFSKVAEGLVSTIKKFQNQQG